MNRYFGSELGQSQVCAGTQFTPVSGIGEDGGLVSKEQVGFGGSFDYCLVRVHVLIWTVSLGVVFDGDVGLVTYKAVRYSGLQQGSVDAPSEFDCSASREG